MSWCLPATRNFGHEGPIHKGVQRKARGLYILNYLRMKRKSTLSCLPAVLFILHLTPAFAQHGALKEEKNPFHKAYHDSLKSMNYDATFPLLGKKAYKKGYDIQLPWGVGIAYFAQRQRVVIQSTKISFNDGDDIDLSGVIEYGDIINHTYANTIRPNLWILPFLNIYGVFGTGKSETSVPLVKPVSFKTTQRFDVSSAGFGATFAGGVRNLIIIVDQNMNYANLEAFVEPVPAYNLDIRFARNFVDPRRADRSVTIWFGAFYQQIKADTKGTIKVSDLFPGVSPEKKEEMKEDFQQWYDNLTPVQQAVVEPMIEHIVDYLDGLNAGDGEIHYNLDKELAGPWNLIFGAQYQHNKHWQIRSEVGTFGERTQFLLNLNYSFVHLKKRK